MNSTHSRTVVKQFYALLLAFSLALTPVAAADAKRVFDKVSPSVVVIRVLEGHGSGVVIGEGLVVTNCHVVEEAEAVVIEQPADSQGVRGYTIEADVVARDDDNDVCLLYAEGLRKPPAAPAVRLGAAKDLAIGEEVYAVGAPNDLKLSLSRGIVTQLRSIKGKAPLVQTDATIWFGSSGGGLFNEQGELIGITTFGPEDNINFAMPVEMVADLIKSYRNDAEGKAQAMCMKTPQYQCILVLAVQSAKQIDDVEERFQALRNIAIAQAQAGYFEDAKTTIQQVPTIKFDLGNYVEDYITDYASDLLSDIAIERSHSGEFNGAKATAEQIDDDQFRIEVLGEIAISQAYAGYFDDAKATAKQIDDVDYLAEVLVEVAIAQAQADKLNEAKMTALEIDDDFHRAIALSRIAIVQGQAGYFDDAEIVIDDALHLSEQINASHLRAGALSEIAIAKAKVGHHEDAKMFFDEVLHMAEQVENAYPRDTAFSEVAIAQARAGYFKDAQMTIERIVYITPHDDALIGIANIQAESGDFADAMHTAQLIQDDGERIQVLANIAAAMTEQ